MLLWNVIKFVATLGHNRDLLTLTEPEHDVTASKFNFSEEFKDLVFQMMSYNHQHRPTLEQIRAHPWMQAN